MSKNESGLVTVRPTESLRLETQRRLIGARSHHVAVDRLAERLDERRVHRFPAGEFVRSLHPIDAPVLSRDEAVEARRHVDRYL